MSLFSFYYPGDGEDRRDARLYHGDKWANAYDAAQYACEFDYDERSGWERKDESFPIIVLDSDGNKHVFTGSHQPSVEHMVDSGNDTDWEDPEEQEQEQEED